MFVTSFYLVRDKLCFSRTRWMSYGLCSLAREMWNQSQETYEEYQNLESIMKEIWKEYEDKDGGGSVQEISRLMKIFKVRWWKFVMESLESNILSEDMMKMYSKPNGSISIPRIIYLSHPGDNEVRKSK